MTQVQPYRIAAIDAAWLRANLTDALEIYGAAMGYPSSVVMGRHGHAAAHTIRPDFSAVGAFDEQDRLIGFGYGYATRPGQWWRDQVAGAIGRAGTRAWLTDSYELCEFHVQPGLQGFGVGRTMLRTLLGGVRRERVLLSTPDQDTRAFRLYRSEGFTDVLRGYLFPGDQRPFAVLGVSLPLASAYRC